MFDKIRDIAGKAKKALSKTALLVGDLNGDGKIDEEDARIAAEWTKKKAASVGDEVSKLGKEAMQSDLAKDAATGAGIGAVVAIPVPIIGPLAGAAVGAGVGVYKNITKPNQPTPVVIEQAAHPKDVHDELLKLEELKQKKIITQAEFEAQKKKILEAST